MTVENKELKEDVGASFGVNASAPGPVVGAGGPVQPRKADKKGPGEPMPVVVDYLNLTKAGMVKEIFDLLNSGSKQDVAQLYKAIVLGEEDNTEVEPTEGTEEVVTPAPVKEAYAPKKVTKSDLNISEDVTALFSGTDLTEDFKSKAVVIFENAILTQVNKFLSEQTETAQNYINEEYKNIKNDLVDKIDGYLDEVVESWLEDNKLAVEKGVRAEISESLLNGLRDLFYEHWIDIPEDKVDIVSGLAAKKEELESALNTSLNKNVQMTESLEKYRKNDVIVSMSQGLSATEVEKLRSLTENVDYVNQDDFKSKVETMKEKYLNKGAPKDANSNVRVDTKIITESTNLTEIDYIANQIGRLSAKS